MCHHGQFSPGKPAEGQCRRRSVQWTLVFPSVGTNISPFEGRGDKQGKQVQRADLPLFLLSSGDFKFGYEPLECREEARGEFGDKGD